MKEFDERDRPEIEYPTRWKYTAIGADRTALDEAIKRVFGERDHEVSLSNMSSKGKYVSLMVETEVSDEDERLALFKALQDDAAVKIVL